MPIASLGDWVELRQRLAAVPAIRKIDLLSLSRQQAKIEIKYVGNPDQLKSSLAEADLDLDGGDPDWRLFAGRTRRVRNIESRAGDGEGAFATRR